MSWQMKRRRTFRKSNRNLTNLARTLIYQAEAAILKNEPRDADMKLREARTILEENGLDSACFTGTPAAGRTLLRRGSDGGQPARSAYRSRCLCRARGFASTGARGDPPGTYPGQQGRYGLRPGALSPGARHRPGPGPDGADLSLRLSTRPDCGASTRP